MILGDMTLRQVKDLCREQRGCGTCPIEKMDGELQMGLCGRTFGDVAPQGWAGLDRPVDLAGP